MSHWPKQKSHGWVQSPCEDGLVRFSRGREPLGYVCLCIYHTDIIRHWLVRLWRLASPKICRLRQQAGDAGEPVVWLWSEGQQARDTRRASVSDGVQRQKKPMSQLQGHQAERILGCSVEVWGAEGRLSFLVMLSLVRAIFFTQCTDLNVNLTQKHPHRNNQNNVWPEIWAPVVQAGGHTALITPEGGYTECAWQVSHSGHECSSLPRKMHLGHVIIYSSPKSHSSLSQCLVWLLT